MSVRLATRFLKHGRFLFQHFWKRDIHGNIHEQKQNPPQRLTTTLLTRRTTQLSGGGGHVPRTVTSTIGQLAANSVHSTGGVYRFGQQARKLFVDSILNRVTTTYSSELRQQATKKLFYGDSAPFFALIGVGLASGAGILTKEDELECVCYEINEAAGRLQHAWNTDDVSEKLDHNFNIDKLNIGPALAKGCAAVVYAATLKNTDESTLSTSTMDDGNQSSSIVNDRSTETENSDFLISSTPQRNNSLIAMESGGHDVGRRQPRHNSLRPEFLTPIHNMSRFVHNFGGSVDNVQLFNHESSIASVFGQQIESSTATEDTSTTNNDSNVINELSNVSSMQQNTDGDGDESSSFINLSSTDDESHTNQQESCSIQSYPLALKMMFNYDIQSNALSILRAMYKETVPARQRYLGDVMEVWEKQLQDQTLMLPPHPNIVCMYGFFCDEVRNFPDGHRLYPIALPQRLNPHGYGRNMSLYLLMKRYDYTLRNYLDKHPNLTMRTKLLLFAQLLEGIVHLNRHSIAHRDLKTDNILIELNETEMGVLAPTLVLSDFGCCLADRVNGLKLPYNSMDIDKGGNATLMAPEIINKQPGQFTVLNYNKSDLWACGAIAYEILGLRNPFYSNNDPTSLESEAATQDNDDAMRAEPLKNTNYMNDDLPHLGDECPILVQHLIRNLLSFNPSERLNPDVAANVMQLFLWAPSLWLKSNNGIPNSPEILQWLLSLTTKVMYEGRSITTFGVYWRRNDIGRRTLVEYGLICSFLSRVRLRSIRMALNWIQSVV